MQKAEYKSAGPQSTGNTEENTEDCSIEKYGHQKMIQSADRHLERNFVDVSQLIVSPTPVWVRGRIHASRCKGKQCFLVLRQQSSTVQCIISVNDVVSKQMVKFSGSYA